MSRATGIKSPAVLARESRRSGQGGTRGTPATDYNCGPTTTTGGGWRAEHGSVAHRLTQVFDAHVEQAGGLGKLGLGLFQGFNLSLEASNAGVDVLADSAAHDRFLRTRSLGIANHLISVIHVISKAARTRAACGVWSLEPVGLVRSQDNLAHVDGYPKGKANDGKREKAQSDFHGSLSSNEVVKARSNASHNISSNSNEAKGHGEDLAEGVHSGHLALGMALISSNQCSAASLSDADHAGLDESASHQRGVGLFGVALAFRDLEDCSDHVSAFACAVSDAMEVGQGCVCSTAGADEGALHLGAHLANQLRPNQVPIVGPQILAGDIAGCSLLDRDTVFRGWLAPVVTVAPLPDLIGVEAQRLCKVGCGWGVRL